MIDWTEDEVTLAATVRGGRSRDVEVPAWGDALATVALDYQDMGGAGVVIALEVEGRALRLFAEDAAWCAWIAPLLTLPEARQIPADLRLPAAHWALAPLAALLAAEGAGELSTPAVVALDEATLDSTFACALTLRCEDRTVSLRLVEWPRTWTHALASLLDESPDPAPRAFDAPSVTLALAAGCVRLRRAQLDALAPGKAVVFDIDARVERKEAWLIHEARPLARIGYLEQDQWEVNEIMSESASREPMDNDEAGTIDDALGTLNFTVVAEIGRLDMTLDAIRALEHGMILDAPASFDGGVTLRVNGRAIGRGRLLRVGERLAVRIE